MKTQLTIQEKLKDLRVERHLTLEQLAELVPVSRSALATYEADTTKDISHINLIALAKFYGVSTDYLLGLTDNREQVNSDLAELHLDDETVEILKSNRINNRLLCEIIRHPEFENLMADIAIYIDGLATQGIVNMNYWLEMLRTQILTQYHPDEKDINLRMTEKAQIEEEDYFFHVTHEDWEKILRDLRKEHMGDTEVRPVGDHISQRVLTAFQNAMRQSNPIEAYWRVYCQEMEIPYDKLSKEEHETMIGVLKKSKKHLQSPSHRHKGRPKK